MGKMTTQTQEMGLQGVEERSEARDGAYHQHWRTEEAVMKWYGWSSAVGMSILLVSVGVCAVLLRYAILGG